MAQKLYPPQLAGSLPAFCKTYNKTTGEAIGTTLEIPYTMNQGVGYGQIDGFCLRIKNVSSGAYICPPIYSTNFNQDKNIVFFDILKEYASILEEGQFYKVQLAYYNLETSSVTVGGSDIVIDKDDPNAKKNIGYFSTVGIIKCVSYPSVTISGYSLESTNLFTGSFLGVYDITDGVDKTEKVYSYSFSIYNSLNELYYTTGELIHNSTNDVEYGLSTDTLIINDFISSSDEVYQIEYAVTTLNGLQVTSPRYRMTSEQLLAPNKKIEVLPVPNNDEAYISIGFKGEVAAGTTEEDVYYGEYILSRACEEDGYTEWIEMHRFRLQDSKPSTVSFRDFSIKQGVKYKYGISQFNIWNIVSSRLESEEVSIDFEDMFLFDGDRQLKIRFNPKISKFGTIVAEQKIETLGNKFPYLFRNAKVEYKEFPIEGLISCLMDDARLFYRTDYDYIINRKYTETKGIDNEEGFFNHFDLTEENVLRERNFKLDVLDWLNNGKPKMFKSATEGNYIVRLFKVSMKPENKLGRMLHSFSCTAYEIADFTYENLCKLGFVSKSSISRYVSLWKTYNFKDWGAGKDVVIEFDDNVTEFLIQDLMPGTKVYLYQTKFDTPLEIVIGVTGSYRYVGHDQGISKIVIPVEDGGRISGTIECQYSGLRYSDFDAIKNISLKTTVSEQFVGVDPAILNLQTIDRDGISDKILMPLNQRILYNDYVTVAHEDNTLTTKSEQIYDALKIGTAGTNKNRFLPGDIIQYIQSDIFDFKKSKVKILNLEYAKFRLRDLIPIYKVPYRFLTEEQQESVQLNGGNTNDDGKTGIEWNIENYDAPNGGILFPALHWSVTPFGQPYPIDDLVKKISGNAVMNDPFCIFEMFEYQNGEWVHLSNQWTVDSGPWSGWYYDAYYGEKYSLEDENYKGKAVTKNYDPTFFIQDRINYVPISNEKNSQEELSLNEVINVLQIHPILYALTNSGEYKQYYDKGEVISSEIIPADDKYYYKSIIYIDGNPQENYFPIDGKVVENYFKEKSYYENILWVKDKYTGKYSKLKDAELDQNSLENIFCIEQLNKIDLTYTREAEFDNLGSITNLNIGNGVIVELTYQAQIIDYYTEESNSEVAQKKKKYEDATEFLKTVFDDYENIAIADSEFRKYNALYKAYSKLIAGQLLEEELELEPLDFLILASLMNIKEVSWDMLRNIYIHCNDENISERLNNLLEQDKQAYDFEIILDIILFEPTVKNDIIKNIILRYYNDSKTYQQLKLMDIIEYYDLEKILTVDEIEGMVSKIQKIQAIVDELNAQWTALNNEIEKQKKDFTVSKEDIKNKAVAYNNSIREWAMCLFLTETQLHTWTDEDGQTVGPYSLSDIKTHYTEIDFELDEEINKSGATIESQYVKAENIISEIEAIFEELRVYEKIKEDKSDDEAFDNYIANKEFKSLETVFVRLQQLNLIYQAWAKEDVQKEDKLKIMFAEAREAVTIFLLEYDTFKDFHITIPRIFRDSVKDCDTLLTQIKAYYPEYDNLEDVTEDKVVVESKETIKKYIVQVDELECLVNYFKTYYKNIEELSISEMESSFNPHKTMRNLFLDRFLTVSELQQLNQQRPVITEQDTSSRGILESANLAINEEAYFLVGLQESSDREKAIEKKEKIKVLLKLIEKLESKLSKTTPEKVIQEIYNSYITMKNKSSSTPNLLNIIFQGYSKDGLNNAIKIFNSSIELKRIDMVSGITQIQGNEQLAKEFYDQKLIIEEFQPYIQQINNDKVLKNEELLVETPLFYNNFSANAKYQRLIENIFDSGAIFNGILDSSNPETIASDLAKVTNIGSLQGVINININDSINSLFTSNGIINNAKLEESSIFDIQKQITMIYSNTGIYLYILNEFLSYLLGNSDMTLDIETGIFYWYLRYNMAIKLEEYAELLRQASILHADYSSRNDNYSAKRKDYLEKYNQAYEIYGSYNGTESWNYYYSAANDKQQMINQVIVDMQTAWNEFILALDKAFTEEVERGMYI